jgi:hypothetical protein
MGGQGALFMAFPAGKERVHHHKRNDMTQMDFLASNDCIELEAIDLQEYPLEPATKERFHKLGRRVLKQLAERLGLQAGSYDIRSCLGGPAVGGEVTLHGEGIYIQICDSPVPAISLTGVPQHCRVMYRSCEGRTDYCGGSNRWCGICELGDDMIITEMRRIAHRRLDSERRAA